WQGATAEAVDWHCAGESRYELTSSRYRLGVVLEQSGGRCETRTNPRISAGYPAAGRPFLTITPPRMPVWAGSENIRFTRSVSLAFDTAALVAQGNEALRDLRDLVPHFNLGCERICTLAGLLATECRMPGLYGNIYGESLITAILVELIRLSRTQSNKD